PVFSSPALPRIAPPTLHARTPSRSPARQRHVDDILSDLSPSTTLEAFKNPSGRLRASIEDATPSEQAFGLRAALASKNIQEWVDELSNWSWPAEGGSLGFEVPPAKRRKLSSPSDEMNEPEYVGSLLAAEVLRYEIRLDEITADMEELNVEEIKRQVLDTHFSARSRPSSSASNSPMPSFLSSYTKMDDFTAIVTTTVLQALPNLSKLMRLMDVWSIRLSVLRKVPPLLLALEDAEIALKSGWNTINNPGSQSEEDAALSRETFGIMREVLQDKVTTLGQDLDYMLDTLEGREDTLPESWLDRMEAIEQDYGEWVVAGDRKVREGEWAKMAKLRQEAEEARKLKERSPSTTISPIIEPEDSGSSESPRSPQSDIALANFIRRASTPKLFTYERPSSSDSMKSRKSLQPNGILTPREAGSVPRSPTRSLSDLDSPVMHTDPDIPNDECIVNILSPVHEEKTVRSYITGTSGDECEISIPSPRRSSISSDTLTVVNGQGNDAPASSVGSPISPGLEAFPEVDESPTAGRIGHRKGTSYDYSPPDSPSRPAFPKRPSLNLEQNPSSGSDLTGPLTPLDAPVFDEIDLSPAPVSSPKKANSDEQLQKQISTLLESIPARIRLTSELEANPFSSNILQPKKTRRSITPSFRPSSSMSNYSTSSRAPTPSFTLAPAFSKTNHRSRTPGNPEIKLYHLSRSTGEAPIKLFVRLVGEHGERVMVRVGGGWADLGEYLKEYASHHGRRTAADNDRIEIQDLPPRVVSSSSTISSSATIRGNGRESPIPGPHSVLERSTERPGSSLKVRKTRKSVGEMESRADDVRSPSTPLPNANRLSYETPPSVAGSEASSTSTGPSFRSSSRLSWTDEDTSLGLAGPKSKKVAISEKDQEWVESMKEKVRQASAEKERRNKEKESMKESQRKTSFGEMDRIGGTKRLFRKG
ncbi:hypothetical protein NA56DRAFT_542048, partial [Hyaloscypha hepaticicola]